MAGFVAALVLVVFALCGSYVLEFFGFSLSAFKIASGIYLIIVSLGLLFNASGDGETATSAKPKEEIRKSSSLGVAVTPLAIPLLAGPGMISVVVMRCAESVTLGGKFFLTGAVFVAFVVFLIVVSAAMFGSRYIGKFVLDMTGKFTGVYAAAVGFLACFSGITTSVGL
jgi:multiple antibiotic resistance protein